MDAMGNSSSYDDSIIGLSNDKSQSQNVAKKVAPGSAFSDYNVDSMIYPTDLLSAPEYSSNKVVFFINVAAGSKMSKSDVTKYGEDSSLVDLFDIPESDITKTSGKRVEEAAQGAVDGVNAINPIKMEPLMLGKMKRLSKAIALHMPNSIVQRTGVSWSETDLLASNPITTIGLDVASKMKSDGFGAGVNAGLGGAAGAALRGSKIGQRATRSTPGNTGQEMLFEGVDYRSLSFSYSFTPRNKQEADNVMNIIRTFKYHMLPEFRGESEYLYIYPSEFQIKYYTGNQENQYVEKQLTAVLMNISIDYTPLGQFATFKDGMPQKINMSLEFKEIGIPTKETASFGSKRGI